MEILLCWWFIFCLAAHHLLDSIMSLRWLSWERRSGRSIADGFLTFLCIDPLRLHEHAQVVADIPFQFELGLLRLAIVLDVDGSNPATDNPAPLTSPLSGCGCRARLFSREKCGG